MSQDNAQSPISQPAEREGALRELAVILEKEMEIYQQIETKMQEKKTTIISGHAKSLMEIDQQLLVLHQQTIHLEENRLGLMGRLGHDHEKSFGEFIDSLNPQEAKPFREIRRNLIRRTDNIRELNENNRRLLDLSIKWIHDTVEIIANALVPEGASYDSKGQSARQKGNAPALPIQSTVERSV